MNVRQRKLKDDTSRPHINVRSISSIKHPRKLKKVFILLIVLALVVTYLLGIFAGQSLWLDGLATSLGYEREYHYAVIIDAGSSGSRVLAYKFRVPFTVFGPADLDLVEEYFEQSKPGLSSYADDPAKGAETIVKLIKNSESFTSVEKRASTPLVVRATAGLRLLPRGQAERLVAHVARAVHQLGYGRGPRGEAADVAIMSGADEGIYIWYTVNLLHHLLPRAGTMAALDLGGGSTQVTFQVGEGDHPPGEGDHPPGDLHRVPVGGGNVTLYTHSYLNFGLLAARYGVFLQEANGNESSHFTSVCVEPIIQNEPWTYANKQYYISGAARPAGMKRAAAYAACHAAVLRYVARAADAAPRSAPPVIGPVAAMSYFYDVAADAGLIDVMTGGRVSVAAYRGAARRACSASNVEQPFACLDLALVAALLQDLYRIQEDHPISLFKKVNGHEVSWALGLAYRTVLTAREAATRD